MSSSCIALNRSSGLFSSRSSMFGVNGLLNTVQFYATTDSEVEVARCYFEAARAARKGGVDPEATAYKLDKMIWLLCTSDFYLEGGLKLFSTNALVESNLSAYSGDGI